MDKQANIIKNIKNDKEPANATYCLLKARQAVVKKRSITVRWSKVQGAKGYIIYGNRCGDKYSYKELAQTKNLKYTYKRLKKGKYYKFLVVAYTIKNGKERVIATSKSLHIATLGGKVGNHKKVKVAKKRITLRKGKKKRIKATPVPKSRKLKVVKHRGLKYESSNERIAKVSRTGKVTGLRKGVCYIYVFAQNGKYKKVKVTVK